MAADEPATRLAHPAPRVPLIVNPTPDQQALFDATALEPGVEPLNLFRVLAHHPTLMKRTNVLAGMFMTRGLVPIREREILILRVAVRTGSAYELHQHREIAVRCGLRPGEIDALASLEISSTWSPAEATLIRLADTLMDGTSVDDELWAAAARSWDDAQLLEIVMMVGFYRMLAGLMDSVRLPLDGPPAQQRDEKMERG